MLLEASPDTKASHADQRAVGEYVLHKVVSDSVDSALARGDIGLAETRKSRGAKHLQDAHTWQLENQDVLEAQAREEMERSPR